MKKRLPRKRTATAVAAAVLLFGHAVIGVYAVSQQDAAADQPLFSTAASSNKSWWKAAISDYDASLSLVQYEEVEPTPEDLAAQQDALKVMASLQEGQLLSTSGTAAGGVLASSSVTGAAGGDTAVALGSVSAGQFAFTSYGYGHGVGLSQNGANYYATYGGWDYQSILFHYYPGTSLVQVGTGQTITADGYSGSVLDIVSMVVNGEMGDMETEALKAQAVAAYTYILHKGGNAPDVYCKPNPPQRVIDAVSSVLGQVLMYDGDYANTVFCASSGGYTASAEDIFDMSYDYLVSVPCEYDAAYDPYYGEVTYLSTEEVRNRIQGRYGVTLTGSPSSWIQLNVGAGGYVKSVTLGGQKTVNGDQFRSVLGLRSARFNYIVG